MVDQQSSYRQIFKATSVFGGVQVFQVIIQIVRSKFIAIILGPAGMGIMGLLSATTGLIGGFTSFGLGTSAVKEIAAANETRDKTRIGTATGVIKRLVWITGIFGLILTICLSGWLSQLTFKTKEYTIAFIWISIALLFTQLNIGQLVILQGMRKLKDLAIASLLGSLLGLVFTVPIYYKFKNDGIVPGIIITSVITLLVTNHFAKRININPIDISFGKGLEVGKKMLTMGFIINLSTFLAIGASYVIRIFISRTGNLADVGLFNAGISIVSVYVGLIFNAMGTDFYPRLSAALHDNTNFSQTINQQAEISILILAPIIVVFLVFINWIIILLYSKQFIAIDKMILWAMMGMFFRVIIWIMGFLFLVKSDSKVYFWNEFTSIIYTLALNMLGYELFGITGLGISIFISYLLAMVQAILISKIKFSFTFSSQFKKIFVYQIGIALITFCVVAFLMPPYTYLIGILLIIASCYYSAVELDKRLGLLSVIFQLIRKGSRTK